MHCRITKIFYNKTSNSPLFVLTKELQALALDVEIFDEVEDDE